MASKPDALAVFFRRHYVFGGMPFLAALLVFYGITSGSILSKMASPKAPLLKFGLYSIDENGRPHTPLDQLRLAKRFMGELADFTLPLSLLGYFAALGWKAVRRSLNFFDFIFPVTVAAFLLVPFNGATGTARATISKPVRSWCWRLSPC